MTTFASANSVYIPGALNLSEGGKEFSLEADFFQTTSVVDERGEARDLTTGTSYSKIDVEFRGGYGFTDELQGIIGGRGRNIIATDNFGTEDFNYNQVTFESFLVGLKYGFKEKAGLKYAIEGTYRFLLSNTEEFITGSPPANEVTNGEVSRELSIGFHAYSRSRSNNFLTASLFYRDPSQKLSSEIFSRIDYNLVWKYFSFGVGVENNFSLENDRFENDPENKPQVYNGGSELFNSVNRSWTAPYLQANLSFGGNWRIESRYSQVVTGNSTDLGQRVSLAIVNRAEKDQRVKEFKKTDSAFKQYKVEGLVTKVSKKRTGCLIDKGLVSGVELGQRVDFFFFDYVDGSTLIASGKVVKVQANRSVVKISRKYSKKRVEAGIVARVQQLLE